MQRTWVIIGIAIVLGLGLTYAVYALMGPDGPARADSIVVENPREGMGRGNFGGGGRGEGRFGMFAGGGADRFGPGRNEAVGLMGVLGELNLTPQFTLTPEQKEKLHAVQTAFRNAQIAWQKQHTEELRKIEEAFRKAREADQRDQFRPLMEQREKLTASAPGEEDLVKQIKAVLTPDQLKVLDAKLKERQADQAPRQWEIRGGRGGGQMGMQGGRQGRDVRPATRPAAAQTPQA